MCNKETLVLRPKLFSYQVGDLGTANLEDKVSKESSSGIPYKKGAVPWRLLEDSSHGQAVPPQPGTTAHGFACHKPLMQQVSSWVSVENNNGSNT